MGGVSFVGIVFINEGIVAPLSLFPPEKKEEMTVHEKGYRPTEGAHSWLGSALHAHTSGHGGLRTAAGAGVLRRRAGRSSK